MLGCILTVGAIFPVSSLLLRSYDSISRRQFLGTAYEIVAWTELEMQLAIVCASAPALKSLISSVSNGATRNGASAYAQSAGTSMKGVDRDRSLRTVATKNDLLREYEESSQKGILVTETLSIQSTSYRQTSLPKQNFPPLASYPTSISPISQCNLTGSRMRGPANSALEHSSRTLKPAHYTLRDQWLIL